MNRTLFWVVVAGASTMACNKAQADRPGVIEAGVAQTAPLAPAVTPSAAPPKDVPAFLTRFCDAVAAADKGYVTAHVSPSFTTARGSDPDAPTGGRKKRGGGGYHAADSTTFDSVCGRVRAQPPGEIARRVREQDGTLLVRLRQDGLASDLVIERVGADFKLLREDPPDAKAPAGRGGGW